MTRVFKLPYRIVNNGDGSVSVIVHRTLEEALAAEQEDDEQFGEPCASEHTLRVADDGSIECRGRDGVWFKLPGPAVQLA